MNAPLKKLFTSFMLWWRRAGWSKRLQLSLDKPASAACTGFNIQFLHGCLRPLF